MMPITTPLSSYVSSDMQPTDTPAQLKQMPPPPPAPRQHSIAPTLLPQPQPVPCSQPVREHAVQWGETHEPGKLEVHTETKTGHVQAALSQMIGAGFLADSSQDDTKNKVP